MNSGCGALVLFLMGTCGTASVVGGIVGAINTDADAAKRAATRRIDQSLRTTPAQWQLRDRLILEAKRHGKIFSALELAAPPGGRPDYAASSLAGTDAVLELELTRVGTSGPGGGAPSQLYMEARARIIRVADGQELAMETFAIQGQRYTTRDWQANGGERLMQGFENAYERLAEKIYTTMVSR